MKLPKESDRLIPFVRELIDECMVSRDARRLNSQLFRQLFYTGSTGPAPSKYNRCYSHVDKLSSYIFSAADMRLTVEFEGDTTSEWMPKAEASSRWLNRRFKRENVASAFGRANVVSLVEGAAIAKITNGPGGTANGWVIRPPFFGVLREDIEDLDRQEAFVHSFYQTQAGFRRMIRGHIDEGELKAQVSTIAAPANAADLLGDSYFHQIIAGNLQPVGYQGAPAQQSYGAVGLTVPQMPMLDPKVAGDLIRVDELWVWDDEARRGEGDWVTIRYVEPGLLIEGKYQRRNLGDVGPGSHPFVKVCSNEVEGYFWGRSEMANLFTAQDQLTQRTNDIDLIWRLRAKPPRAFSGFNATSEDRLRALLSPGATITEQAIGAKVDNLAPDLPPESLEYLNKLEAIFDDVAGFTNILSGQGEPGVRAGVHAGTLLRTSTPRLRDRALAVEGQAGKFATLRLRMAQRKEAKVVVDANGSEFLLSQLPPDAIATVDSHTTSPAFVDDNRNLAYALAKAEAIDGETLIELTHPPHEDRLKAKLRARQQAEAEFAAANPVAAAEAAKKK